MRIIFEKNMIFLYAEELISAASKLWVGSDEFFCSSVTTFNFLYRNICLTFSLCFNRLIFFKQNFMCNIVQFLYRHYSLRLNNKSYLPSVASILFLDHYVIYSKDHQCRLLNDPCNVYIVLRGIYQSL